MNLLGQPFRVDSTNSDLSTAQPHRRELLPHLTACYNPAVARVLARLAEQAEELYRDEEAVAVSLLSAAELPRRADAGSTGASGRRPAPADAGRAAAGLAREGWPLDAMNYAAWERLAGLATAKAGPRTCRAASCAGREHVLQVGPTMQPGAPPV